MTGVKGIEKKFIYFLLENVDIFPNISDPAASGASSIKPSDSMLCSVYHEILHFIALSPVNTSVLFFKKKIEILLTRQFFLTKKLTLSKKKSITIKFEL